MIRAGVFIGVDQTGRLQKLSDAAAGAKRMYDWALAQGVDANNAKLITDADGKVSPDMIFDAIRAIVDGPGVDQLLVYFAGHGVNIARNEHWLLTDAPDNGNAAINVSGSVELARYCGIPHIVIISDACRVAPEGIRAQNVRGQDMFPNESLGDRAKPVDQFFACFLGRTAAEVRDANLAAGNYSALYTDVLLHALSGECRDILEPGDPADDGYFYVKPLKLQTHLEIEVPKRVRQLNLQQKVNQNPDAIITSHKEWLARLLCKNVWDEMTAGGIAAQSTTGSATRSIPTSPRVEPPNLRNLTHQLMQSAAAGRIGEGLAASGQGEGGQVRQIAQLTERIATPFGPNHFETQCGIKVRGARMVSFLCRSAEGELLGSEGDILRIEGLKRPAANVLLRFENGTGTVIPALPGFLAALTFDEGELVDVAYEPSVTSPRWNSYQAKSEKIRALRAVAAASSQHGRFRLEGDDAVEVGVQMQIEKGVDPTLAVYAAYAYNDLQAIDRIREMANFMNSDLGVTLFDVALLSKKPINTLPPEQMVVPFFPLLSQGWALLDALRVRLPSKLKDIQYMMVDSLWSLFNAEGVEKLTEVIQTEEVL